MNSFYSIVYDKFAELQVSEQDSARFAYPIGDLVPFLTTGRKISDCVVGIPPIQLARKAISYGPFVFEDSEFGQVAAVKTMLASVTMLSAKSIYRWIYRDFIKEWLSKKTDQLRARYVMSIILDAFARRRVRQIQGEAFYDDAIRTADALSLLLQPRVSIDYSVMAQTALTSFVLDVPVYLPASILKVVQGFVSNLDAFAASANKINGTIERQVLTDISAAKITKKQLKWGELSSLGNSLYATILKVPGKWHNMYLPYSHLLSGRDVASASVFESGLLTAEDFDRIRPAVKGLHVRDEALWQETFFEFVREKKFREKIMQKLRQATRQLNFSDVMFPVCDYVSFSRVHSELSADIRRMSDRVRMVKNAFDENTFQEVGNVDLQLAIQAIASESKRSDIFTRDEEQLKEESWTILIDSSKSLSGSSNDLRAVSICLAETAHQILGTQPWSMFAFSDELFCIKDFAEKYDNLIKARIGGLRTDGLSYIPDALRACCNLVKQNSRDRNFLILVSDGVPSGYSNIEDEFGISVKELKSFGIGLIAIGMGSDAIKKTVRNARVIDKPSDITKQFMQIYTALAS
ncbi:MAG: hypothetical protein ACREAQ_09010 [Nitrososphaera sp.]